MKMDRWSSPRISLGFCLQAMYASYAPHGILRSLSLLQYIQACHLRREGLRSLDQASCVSGQETAQVHTYSLVVLWQLALSVSCRQDSQMRQCFEFRSGARALVVCHPFL